MARKKNLDEINSAAEKKIGNSVKSRSTNTVQNPTSTTKKDIQEIRSTVNNLRGLSSYQKKGTSTANNQVVESTKKTDEEIIKEYESIPNHNILSRGFSGVSSSGAGRPATQEEIDYNRKQELYKDYRQAKNRQISSFIADNNISETSLTNAKSYNDVAHPDSFFKGAMTSSAIVGSYDYNNIKKLADASGIDMKDIFEYEEAIAAQNAKDDNTKYADEHGVIGTLASVPVNIYGSVANLIDNTGKWLSGKPVGSNESINAISDTAGSMRNAVSENIDSPVGKFMYNVGTSIADNVALMPLGPGISLAGMGAEAASGTLNDMKDKNVTPNQMMGTAATSGLIEALTEKIPLDNLFKIAKSGGKQTVKQIIGNVLKQAGVEGAEEGISEIANSIADYAINQDESNWSQLVKYYESLGMTKTQAENQAYLQFGLNAVQASAAGAVSGGIMAGGASAFANANSNIITPEQFQANEEYIQRLQSINDGQNYLDSYNERAEKVPDMRDLSTFQNGVSSDSQNNVDSDAYTKMLDRVQNVQRTGSEDMESSNLSFDVEVHPNVNNYRTHKVINEINLTSSPDMGPLPTADNLISTNTVDSSSLFNNSIPNSGENVNEGQKSYTSRTALNSFLNSEMVKRAKQNLEVFQKEIDNEKFNVDRVSESQSIEKAAENISKDYESVVSRLKNTDTLHSGVETDEAMMILDKMLSDAEHTGDYANVLDWAKMVVNKAHNVGQALQAFAKYSRTPEGTIIKAQQIINAQAEAFYNNNPNARNDMQKTTEQLWEELENAQSNIDKMAQEIKADDEANELKERIKTIALRLVLAIVISIVVTFVILKFKIIGLAVIMSLLVVYNLIPLKR